MPVPVPCQCNSSLFPRTAELSVDFLIVGASIAGLACAYNLKQAGHRVRVVEQNDGVGKATGALRSPPNMTRLLLRWGLREKLRKFSIKCSGMSFRQGATGECINSVAFHKELMKALEADLLMMHHADLHTILYELAIDSGVHIDFNSSVVDVNVCGSPSYVTLHNGKKIFADIIVGADGGQSIVRRALVGGPEVNITGPYTGYCFTVPTARMKDDSELEPFTRDTSWNIWMGNYCCVLTHLIRGGAELAVQLFWPDGEKLSQKGWRTCVPLSAFDFSALDPRVQRLMRLAPSAVQTRHVIQAPLEDWSHPSGNAVVIGEAAHLLNPGGSHNTAMGIEDAAVLGSLFSRLRTWDQRTHLLVAFQELRQERCRSVQESEYSKVEFGALPDGPQQVARDTGMRAAASAAALDWADVSEGYLREQWEEFRTVFGYDAYDEADGWWVEWGFLRERAVALDPAEQLHLFFHHDITIDDK